MPRMDASFCKEDHFGIIINLFESIETRKVLH